MNERGTDEDQLDRPPLEWVRLVTRAAELVTALAHPDLAALVAAAPRRPGESIAADELRQRAGLDLKPFAAAVSRGRNAGVLRAPAPGRLAVDPATVDDLVDELARLTPLGRLIGDRPDLHRFARHGRISEVPVDPDLREALLTLVVQLVPQAPELSEAEVNAALLLGTDDPATLRRELVDAGLPARR